MVRREPVQGLLFRYLERNVRRLGSNAPVEGVGAVRLRRLARQLDGGAIDGPLVVGGPGAKDDESLQPRVDGGPVNEKRRDGVQVAAGVAAQRS